MKKYWVDGVEKMVNSFIFLNNEKHGSWLKQVNKITWEKKEGCPSPSCPAAHRDYSLWQKEPHLRIDISN